MTPAPRARRAIALSSFDLPDAQELLLHDCEDCACPVSDSRSLQARSSIPSTAVSPIQRSWVRSADVFEMRLDPEHRLLFNPVGRGGVVVVNELALPHLPLLSAAGDPPGCASTVPTPRHDVQTGTHPPQPP